MKNTGELDVTDGTRRLLECPNGPRILAIRNRDIKRVLIGPPRDRRHLRTIMFLDNGVVLVFHQATVENLARGMISITTHPLRRAVSLKSMRIDGRKEGYAEYQLLEEEIDEDEIISRISDLLSEESQVPSSTP